MPSARRSVPLLLTIAAIVVGACEEDPPGTVLQGLDFANPDGESGAFDRNNVIEPAAFTDYETIDLKQVQRFLGRTPYERPSFLETYQSNGVRASDAIIAASRIYRINPLVFLVFAQTTQGLVGERAYPFPPVRVEYVFRCGCLSGSSCLPELAGFDRQVDCLGRALRESLDQIKADGQTITGWGPDKTSLTLDNAKVTPQNDATAVIYARTAWVNENKAGGSWVFWNIWNLYAPHLNYFGATGGSDGRWIGEPCMADAVCGFANAICARNYPEGLCTMACTGECPNEPSRTESFCAKFRDGGFCLQRCNPITPACRPGYKCVHVAGVAAGLADDVCSPEEGAPP